MITERLRGDKSEDLGDEVFESGDLRVWTFKIGGVKGIKGAKGRCFYGFLWGKLNRDIFSDYTD